MNRTTGRSGAPQPGYENLGDKSLAAGQDFTLPPGFPQQPHEVPVSPGHAANLARANRAAADAHAKRAKFDQGRQRRPLPQEDEYMDISQIHAAGLVPGQQPPPQGFTEQQDPFASQPVAQAAPISAPAPQPMAAPQPFQPAPQAMIYAQPVEPPPLSFPPSFPSQPASGANPLLAFTRMPGMHIKLPSHGAYMPPGSIAMTATGELPVYPMRAADEVLLKNPDALMSGVAVDSLIRSCVPGITEPQAISMPDLDVLMLAIRAASYGDKMEFEVRCPKCKAENVFDAHLPSILATTTDLPHDCPIPLTDGVTAFMRPYSLRNATQVAIVTFEETRRVQGVENAPDDIRQKTVTIALKRINELTTLMLCDCVMCVVTPNGTVTDPAHIKEFLANIPRDWTNRMETALKDLNSHGLSKKIDPTCSKCGHHWETELEFDPGSFFGRGS